MEMTHGNLSINSNNIFPIIKKWMYSDKDIFIRELVSNGCDAITKRKKLAMLGETELPDGYRPSIQVLVNDAEKTLKFIDNGIGMSADEVVKDIAEIAFSGATEFLEKYKDKADSDQIIGHFGLGFYSAFMVADQVDIDTLSFRGDEESVHWECDGGTEYDMGAGNWSSTGTQITLHLNEDSLEFANEYKVREVLEKYCSFMPVEIFLKKENADPEYDTIEESELREDDTVIERIHEDARTEEKTNDKGETETVEIAEKNQVKILRRPVAVNDIHPLWTKNPSECREEEYKDFYRHVFMDYKEPLFWIHLNMDYPFNLKGILYFPRINTEYDTIEGKIKLYNNQVFIADNIKEVIPEYLMLLKGVIDCPDLPLNVSRSALQNDGFVQKISNYISKKVADKLSGMCKTDRENYEKYWEDISPFIKFGTLKDDKFSDKMMDYILYRDLDGKYLTMEEFLDKIGAGKPDEAAGENESAEVVNEDGSEAGKEEPEKTTVYYVTDEAQQSQYINLFRAQEMDALILRHTIDTAFISHLEQKKEELSFQRIDADLSQAMKEEGADLEEETKKLSELFRKVLNQDKLMVKAESLKDESLASVLTLSESSRRMSEMMKMYGMAGMDPSMFAAEATLVLNSRHPLVQYVLKHEEEDRTAVFCEQLYDLAALSNRPLTPEEMTRFIKRSNQIMLELAGE